MFILSITSLVFYGFLWIVSRNYESDFVEPLDEKEHKLKKLYPMALFLMDKLSKNSFAGMFARKSDSVEDSLKALYVGENPDTVKRLYRCNKTALLLLVMGMTLFLSLVSSGKSLFNSRLSAGGYIARPAHGEGSGTVDLNVNVSKDNSTVYEDEIQIKVDEKRYDEKELKDKFSYAREYIDSVLLNRNVSSEQVQSNLKFIASIPDTDMEVSWSTDNLELVDRQGRVHNESIKEAVLVSVTAVISYYDRQEEYTRYFKVLPRTYSQKEQVKESLENAVGKAQEQAKTNDRFQLPDKLGDLKVSWAERKEESAGVLLLLGILAAVVLYMGMDKDLLSRVEKRNREMLMDYTEIINKFTLLAGAGMSLSNAWNKITGDYKDKGIKRYAYEEMMVTSNELKLGTSEATAYERFGRRAKLIPYLRFSSLIAQNIKKGSAGLLEQLEAEAAEAFEERKELAKRLGEEAGTKLLGPMMLMLILVLAIIMVPAFLSFGL